MQVVGTDSPIWYECIRADGHVVLGKHQHDTGYLAVVLEGGYEEAGDSGYIRVHAGDIVLHSAFETHVNRYGAKGSRLIVLGLPQRALFSSPVVRVQDADVIARIAERDPCEALSIVLNEMQPVDCHVNDWPNALAVDLSRDPSLRINHWAHKSRLAEATVSRGFAKVFGQTPTAYRARQKARRAWHMLLHHANSLPDTALLAGFCDQAHMTRAVLSLTGETPGNWRRQCQMDTRLAPKAVAP